MKHLHPHPSLFAALCLVLCAPAWAAPRNDIPESLYRQDLPAVLSPKAAEAVSPEQLQAFSAAYKKARRPKILLFWNRDLSDKTFQKVDRTTLSAKATVREGHIEAFDPDEIEVKSTKTAVTLTREIVDRIPELGRAIGPGEKLDAQIKTGYLTIILQSGVKLVDRTLPLRALAARSKSPQDLDSQTLEMDVLGKYTDLIMEVASIPDYESHTGWGLRVSVKNVKDGVILLNHYESGDDLVQPKRYVADPERGIKLESPKAKDFGAMAAGRVLGLLGAALVTQ